MTDSYVFSRGKIASLTLVAVVVVVVAGVNFNKWVNDDNGTIICVMGWETSSLLLFEKVMLAISAWEHRIVLFKSAIKK